MTAAVTSGPDAVSSDLRCPHASRHRPHAVSTRRPNMLRHRLIGWPRDLEKFSLFFPIGPKARSTRTRSTRSPIAHGRAGAVVCCLSHSQHIKCAPIALPGRPPGTAHSRHHCPMRDCFRCRAATRAHIASLNRSERRANECMQEIFRSNFTSKRKRPRFSVPLSRCRPMPVPADWGPLFPKSTYRKVADIGPEKALLPLRGVLLPAGCPLSGSIVCYRAPVDIDPPPCQPAGQRCSDIDYLAGHGT